MRTIWKFPLEITDVQRISMPVDADVISVVNQNNQIVLYAIVDDTAPRENREVRIFGTGNEFTLPESWKITQEYKFIGTVTTSMDDLPFGDFVWHVFVKG